MRRPAIVSLAAAALMTVVLAGTALGAHCVNESKQPGAGNRTVILIDPVTGMPTILGANPAGRASGGFADVYLDVNRNGELDGADFLLVQDTFLVANHSFRPNPAQGTPAVLPAIKDGKDPGGPGRGVGSAD